MVEYIFKIKSIMCIIGGRIDLVRSVLIMYSVFVVEIFISIFLD